MSGAISQDLRRYYEAGLNLARLIEEVTAEGEFLIAPKSMIAEANSRVEAAYRGIVFHLIGPDDLRAYRRINSLRALASAWLADGGALDSEDLHDMAGLCRIVKRAAREAGILPSGNGAGNPATPQADQAGASAPAGEGDIGPAEVLPARAGERHRTAKPGKVRTHHHPRGGA